jgi:hypothetical protein
MARIWRRFDFPKNTNSSLPCEDYVVNEKKAHDDKKNPNDAFFSPGSEKAPKIPPLYVLFSGHAMRWVWRIDGKTARKPDKLIKMRNWEKRVYSWQGVASIVLNPRTLEIWMHARAQKNPERMIYRAWARADAAARDFSKFAQIGLMGLASTHPADVQAAHLVLDTHALDAFLVPQMELPTSRRIGLGRDFSHDLKPEMTGKESVEGALGADWVFLALKKEVLAMRAEHRLEAEAITELIKTLRSKGSL